MIVEYNNENLDDEFQVLFFYAAYSAACNYNLDVLKHLSLNIPKLKIVKINTTKYPVLKKQFSIHTIPAYVILHNSKILSKSYGSQNKVVLLSWVKQYYSLKEA